MSKPKPRVDETGVSWCDDDCPCIVPKEPDRHPFPQVTIHGTLAHCSITGLILDDDIPCLPAIRAERAELLQLRAKEKP